LCAARGPFVNGINDTPADLHTRIDRGGRFIGDSTVPMGHNIILQIILIFAGASILATLFLYLKQPIILAYIALGMIVGSSGLRLLEDPANIGQISQLGIILLVFLLGLNLHLQKLYKLLRQTALVATATSAVFAALAMLVALAFRFPPLDSLVVGLALMFSSTVICIKLVPTTTLHQKHMGEVIISILLLQDIAAIVLMLFLYGGGGAGILVDGLLLVAKTLAIGVVAVLVVRFGLLRVFKRFDVIQDYLFLVSLGWCLLVAGAAHASGISYEIGAFIAGISLGSSPIALFLAEGLKPVREFFMILFFFAIGARFDVLVAREILVPGLVLAAVMLAAKPLVFERAFRMSGEPARAARELGIRLGQASEFSLLVAYGGFAAGRIEARSSYLIQLVTIVTFVVSTYIVVYGLPTPIALSAKMRQD
jgi:Kef-type K+ transport system membrane component KefB